MKRLLGTIVLIILLVSCLLPSSAVMAQPPPPMPHAFWGTVTIDGSPAPGGTGVTAEINGTPVASTSTIGDNYNFDVPGNAGNTIVFFVNGVEAASYPFQEGGATQLDLSITSPPPQYTLTINANGNGSVSGAGTHNAGTVVPISAAPATGWNFVNWTGDVSFVANVNSTSTTITMNGNYTITANFSQLPVRTLTMRVNGNGTTNPPVGTQDFPDGMFVPISATPAAGWSFVNWTGDVSTVANVNSADTTILMNSDYTITANFSQIPPVTLTMAVNGKGTTTPGVGAHSYPVGTVVDITATPDAGWRFVNWTGEVTNPNLAQTTVTMDKNKTVTANFSQIEAKTYILTLAVSGQGTTSPSAGAHTYTEGTVVNITATPAAGWKFVNWTGDVANPNSASTTVTVDKDKTVTANFSQLPSYTLTIEVKGSGTTEPAKGSYNYIEGTVVNISANPDKGWRFDGWTGEVASPNSASTTVTMDKNKTITANFSKLPDTTPPVISGISASSVTRTSVDIRWTTNEPCDSQVEYWASPGTLTPLDVTMVTQHLVRLSNLNPVTAYHYKVMSRDEGGNLVVSAELTFTTLGTPATFIASDWDISLAEVETGKKATVSFRVTNTGELPGSYKATFKVGGVPEATKDLALNAGASEEVTFTTTKNATGTYQVTVDGLTFSFEVKEAPSLPPTKGPNWWLIIGVVAGVALLALYIILLARRGKLKAVRWPVSAMRAKPREEVTGAMFGAKPQAKAAEEKTRQQAAEAERKTQDTEEKARIAAVEAREKWAGMEVGAKKTGPVRDKKLAGMLTVTALAAEKLKDAIRAKTEDPQAGFRLNRSPDKPNQLKMTLDKAKEGDQVVESEGIKILIISPELIPSLEGMVIDYLETPQGAGFTVSKQATGKK